VGGKPSMGERCAAQPSGRPHEPSGDRRPQMDGHHRSVAGPGGTELGLQTASLTIDRRLGGHPRVVGRERLLAGQSSSGRKMCGAEQVLQIGAAASRSPSGIGTLRSG
jgi:hypothetical protein